MAIFERFFKDNILRLGCDLFLIILSNFICTLTTVGEHRFPGMAPSIAKWLLFSSLVRISIFTITGVYQAIWRYVSFNDACRLGGAVLLSSMILFPIQLMIREFNQLPLNYYIVNNLLLMVMLIGARVLRRFLDEHSKANEFNENRHATLIYGAGVNGRTLAKRFSVDSYLKAHPIGFIDDNPQKIGHSISGLKVLGSHKELPQVLKTHKIQDLVISITGLSGHLLSEIMQTACAHKVRVKMLSDFGLHDRTTSRFELFREVELDDLLSRPSAVINLESVQELIRGKRVLITGAGGSIGKELSRQVANFEPSRLLLLDSSEFNLYSIDHELRASTTDTSFIVPLLLDLRDRHSLKEAMEKYRPQIVFHAAAYKHVHLVELNPVSSVINNIEGTKNLLDFCQKIDVETFLLISTDKAVNPIGIMGSTKRVCEMMVADLGLKTGRKYCAVRFGNVVGSSGSLIPLLKKQIEKGGPITITHEATTRYFMLIPEAVALVLKAASISKPGDISILQMGDPIRIVDIAKNLIILLGKTEEEVPIVYTGMRPGEKLHEELYLLGDELNTEHPDILVLPRGAGAVSGSPNSSTHTSAHAMKNGQLWTQIDHLITSAHEANSDTIETLMDIVKLSPHKVLKAFERPAEVEMH